MVLAAGRGHHRCHFANRHVDQVEPSDHNQETPEQASGASIGQRSHNRGQEHLPSSDKTACWSRRVSARSRSLHTEGTERPTKPEYAQKMEISLLAVRTVLQALRAFAQRTLSSCTLPNEDMSFLSISVPLHFLATIASDNSCSSSFPAYALRTCCAAAFGSSTGSRAEGVNAGISPKDAIGSK